uniref:ABC transporter domain-containing protein n=1 Tax=Strigamia maritima TaxID=126957 RepID=T1IRD2_STRMM
MKAVNKLSFGVDNGTCFGLLGINEAGKTTTFRLLTGDLLIDSGNVIIQGSSIKRNKLKGRLRQNSVNKLSFGVDNGTCFGLLGINEAGKTTTFRLLTGDLLIDSGNVIIQGSSIKRNKLKGRRRQNSLSAALAFIGQPLVVFLDEPTTGVDPVARRKVWNMIKELINGGTASMEECEVLCSRIGIMVKGQFKCLGRIQYLKNKFSQGYTILAKLKTTRYQSEGVRGFYRRQVAECRPPR